MLRRFWHATHDCVAPCDAADFNSLVEVMCKWFQGLIILLISCVKDELRPHHIVITTRIASKLLVPWLQCVMQYIFTTALCVTNNWTAKII